MNKEHNEIEDMLRKVSFRDLSSEEGEKIWRNIQAKKSPLLSVLITQKTMIASLIVTLVLALGVGGTAVAADRARPGDTLFGVDQAMENIRLRFASDSKKDELRIKFANERVKEVETLEDKQKVELGVKAALNLLDGVSASVDSNSAAELQSITSQLNSFLANLSGDVRGDIRIDGDKDRARIDLKSDDGRIRVEIKDGEVRVKQNDDNTTVTSSGKLEIEADVFTNETVVKVELNDRKSSFTTSADTRAEIVAQIRARYPNLTSAQIESALRIEIEDRASRLNDITNVNLGGDDDDDDDNGGNSGSGSSGSGGGNSGHGGGN